MGTEAALGLLPLGLGPGPGCRPGLGPGVTDEDGDDPAAADPDGVDDAAGLEPPQPLLEATAPGGPVAILAEMLGAPLGPPSGGDPDLPPQR